MKSYVTIRDKCEYKNQYNIISHLREKYNEIRIMKFNINSNIDRCFPIKRKYLNRVKTYMSYYFSLQDYKIINNGNYSIYNYTKNNRGNSNSIHNISNRHMYSINKYAKYPKLIEHLQ